MQHWTDLSDEQWTAIASVLPRPAQTGRPRANDRRTLDGILFVLSTGCRWADMPDRYGSYVTCWRRLNRWKDEGTWTNIRDMLLQCFAGCDRYDQLLALLNGRSAAQQTL